jgi:hypothetical protein
VSRERLWYRLEHLFARLCHSDRLPSRAADWCFVLSLCCYNRRKFRTGGDWTDYRGTF